MTRQPAIPILVWSSPANKYLGEQICCISCLAPNLQTTQSAVGCSEVVNDLPAPTLPPSCAISWRHPRKSLCSTQIRLRILFFTLSGTAASLILRATCTWHSRKIWRRWSYSSRLASVWWGSCRSFCKGNLAASDLRWSPRPGVKYVSVWCEEDRRNINLLPDHHVGLQSTGAHQMDHSMIESEDAAISGTRQYPAPQSVQVFGRLYGVQQPTGDSHKLDNKLVLCDRIHQCLRCERNCWRTYLCILIQPASLKFQKARYALESDVTL